MVLNYVLEKNACKQQEEFEILCLYEGKIYFYHKMKTIFKNLYKDERIKRIENAKVCFNHQNILCVSNFRVCYIRKSV